MTVDVLETKHMSFIIHCIYLSMSNTHQHHFMLLLCCSLCKRRWHSCQITDVSSVDYFSLSSTVHMGVANGGQMCIFIGSNSDEAKDQNMLRRQKWGRLKSEGLIGIFWFGTSAGHSFYSVKHFIVSGSHCRGFTFQGAKWIHNVLWSVPVSVQCWCVCEV